MLFTTGQFALLYLPVVLAAFFALGRVSPGAAAAWLFLASVFFYGYWAPTFIILLLGSIIWNYGIGRRIAAHARPSGQPAAKRWLILGIAVDLGLLGYFKYANFFVNNFNALSGLDWQIGNIVLPIGISFFTFTQIAFLADAYQKGTREYQFIHYGLFVTYFPHLIAGPVLHHAQMMPQFREAATYRINPVNLAAGLFIFALGLGKKIILADGISPYADAVFNAAENGTPPDLLEAWIGALAYTFQLYFDFSGYSDMAVGLSWLFNVRLPYNFNSPYRAGNITEFWRRWHMTLSSFLRDYLYIPLGGNRHGPFRRYINLAATMVLGGLWHGASWTFVFWGALHGIYLVINHGFQAIFPHSSGANALSILYRFLGWLITIISVVIAWVFFRAADFSTAWHVLNGMTGSVPCTETHAILFNLGLDWQRGITFLVGLATLSLFLPNSNRIGEALRQWLERQPGHAPLIAGCALILASFLILINSTRDSVSAFIYFNF
ncbi:MAG: MBOAT family protein [Rhodocyclales bacterium GT-UBC]|nr:MAG: MBOAT family protein [Rhodocyclales bacterium GT-UBC]